MAVRNCAKRWRLAGKQKIPVEILLVDGTSWKHDISRKEQNSRVIVSFKK